MSGLLSKKSSTEKPRAPLFRKWMLTVQNPDPAESFPEWLTARIPDLKYTIWAYEMGTKEVGIDNPAYDAAWHEAGNLQGGNLHYQVYFETCKQYRLSAIRKHIGEHWLEQCYAPVSAENYCAKGDKTLVDGPWEFGQRVSQGERNDLKAVHKRIMEGETATSMMRKGECLAVLAKYPRFVKQLETLADTPAETKEEWPLVFADNVMEAPNPSKKRRHWWIHGEPDVGKSYGMEQALGNRPVFYTRGGGKNKMESYDGENLLVFDDCVMSFEELSSFTDTHKYGLAIPSRYADNRLKRGSSRNVIVLSNHTIERIGFKNEPAVKARFIEIEYKGVISPLGYVGGRVHQTRVATLGLEAQRAPSDGKDDDENMASPINCPDILSGILQEIQQSIE
nr:MAG: replication associated protein [Cressdnaviricota sp.]